MSEPSPDLTIDPVRKCHPGLAAVMSLILPGVGQVYTANYIWAVFWLVATPGFWIGTGGLFGWIFHILAAIQSHRQATRRNQQPF